MFLTLFTKSIHMPHFSTCVYLLNHCHITPSSKNKSFAYFYQSHSSYLLTIIYESNNDIIVKIFFYILFSLIHLVTFSLCIVLLLFTTCRNCLFSIVRTPCDVWHYKALKVSQLDIIKEIHNTNTNLSHFIHSIKEIILLSQLWHVLW